jgi:hypothetical protein
MKFIHILFGRREGKRATGKPWRRWEDNVEVVNKGTIFQGVARGRAHWLAVVITKMNIRVTQKIANFLAN